MDNSVIRTAIVTKCISNTVNKNSDKQLKDIEQDIARRIINYRNTLNLDMRNIAVGANHDIWLWQQLLDMRPEWQAIVEQCYIDLEQTLMLKRPQKLLSLNADTSGLMEWKNHNPETELCFLNNDSLAIYENHIRDFEPGYNSAYSVIDEVDLGIEMFDMIQAYCWTLASNLDLAKKCISSLNKSGVLLLMVSSHSAKLYRDDFHAHPYSDIHRLLGAEDGHTYHVASGYGYTVFVKN